jgi:dihydropteroate synthase
VCSSDLVLAVVHGAHVVRVHDVAETVHAVRFAEAVGSAQPSRA